MVFNTLNGVYDTLQTSDLFQIIMILKYFFIERMHGVYVFVSELFMIIIVTKIKSEERKDGFLKYDKNKNIIFIHDSLFA